MCCKKCPSINHHLGAGTIHVAILLRRLPFLPKNSSIGLLANCSGTIGLLKFFRNIINLLYVQIEKECYCSRRIMYSNVTMYDMVLPALRSRTSFLLNYNWQENSISSIILNSSYIEVTYSTRVRV